MPRTLLALVASDHATLEERCMVVKSKRFCLQSRKPSDRYIRAAGDSDAKASPGSVTSWDDVARLTECCRLPEAGEIEVTMPCDACHDGLAA